MLLRCPVKSSPTPGLFQPPHSIGRLRSTAKSQCHDSKGTFSGATALCLACERGHSGAVKELLGLVTISINRAGMDDTTPLMWAAARGHERVVCLLLARPEIDVNAADSCGRTALDWASVQGHLGTAKHILSHPDIVTNVGAGRWKNTPLHHASRQGQNDIVALLLARPEVDVNTQNRDRETPLSQASGGGYEGTVKLLLAHPKVEVNGEDKWGHTALSWAARNGAEGVVKLLLAQPSIKVGTRELEAARSGSGYRGLDLRTREARGRLLSLLEEFRS